MTVTSAPLKRLYLKKKNYQDTTMKLGRYVGRLIGLIVLKFYELRKSYYVTMGIIGIICGRYVVVCVYEEFVADSWLSPPSGQDVCLSLETSPLKLVPNYTWIEWENRGKLLLPKNKNVKIQIDQTYDSVDTQYRKLTKNYEEKWI